MPLKVPGGRNASPGPALVAIPAQHRPRSWQLDAIRLDVKLPTI